MESDKALKMEKKNKTILYFIAAIIFSSTVFGQVVGFLSIDQSYESNPFRYPDEQSSLVSELGMGIQYDWHTFSMSYSGNFSRFETMMERNFYWHQAAGFGQLNNTQYGFTFEQNLNRNEYELFNLNIWSMYINQYFNLWDINFYGNINGELNEYKELEELDNYQIDAGLKLHKSYEIGTTIILGSMIHYKKYLNPNVNITADTVTQSGGHGHGMHGNQQGYINYSYLESEAPTVSQIQLWLRLAQSITQTTGLALQARTRLLLGGTNRSLAGISYNYADESQIFDDPLSYESKSIGVELTQLFPFSMVLKGSYYFTEKDYSVQGIYLSFEVYDNTILRNDTQINSNVSLQRSFKYSLLGDAIVTLKLTFHYLNNDSNSYLYNYENQFINLGITMDF